MAGIHVQCVEKNPFPLSRNKQKQKTHKKTAFYDLLRALQVTTLPHVNTVISQLVFRARVMPKILANTIAKPNPKPNREILNTCLEYADP